MTRSRWAEISSIFDRASKLRGAEREAYLAKRCGSEAELRGEVESLLAVDDGAEEFFDAEFAGQRTDLFAGPFAPGTGLGDYRIERLIGAGGMGSVYLARRDDGEFDQCVAIKTASAAGASGWMTERFKMERRILARLDHPYIARLLGGGTASNGTPFLVMEYIDGLPMARWVADHQPSLRQRLEFFLKVCESVSHAHRNLIVHRDIKPGNILVTLDEHSPASPKLLDFGISKLLDTGCDSSATATIGIMTPAYASPEQVRGGVITTATDVYSLGALLYQLLAGKPPFEFDHASPSQVERTICEVDPDPPSATPDACSKDHDLDVVVLKAMHKSVDRRYSSVEQLSTDIRRYLEGRPVSARPDTIWYRFAKFVTRHRTAALASMALLLALGIAAGRAANEARRWAAFYKQLRAVSRSYLTDLPERVAYRSPAEVQIQLGELFDRQVNTVLVSYLSDPHATREVALGYEALGNQLGDQNETSVGLYPEALRFYGKAIAILTPHYTAGTADQHGAIILARCHCKSARILDMPGGRQAEAASHFQKCGDTFTAAIGNPAPGAPYMREFIESFGQRGDHLLRRGDSSGARQHYQESIRLANGQRHSKQQRSDYFLAGALFRLARLHARSGDTNAAQGLLNETISRIAAGRSVNPRYFQNAATFQTLLLEAQTLSESGRINPDQLDEAADALSRLESKYPAHPLVLRLRRSFDGAAGTLE